MSIKLIGVKKTREHCINAILNQNNAWCEEIQEILDDDDDDEKEGCVQEEKLSFA